MRVSIAKRYAHECASSSALLPMGCACKFAHHCAMPRKSTPSNQPVTPKQEEDRALIRTACGACGLDPTNLARKIGLSPSTLNRQMSQPMKSRLGRSTVDKLMSVISAAKYSDAGNKVIADLTSSGIVRPASTLLVPPRKEQSLDDGMVEVSGVEFVSVPRFDAALSAGPGSILPDHTEPLGYVLFERQWLAAVTRAVPAAIAILMVDGDSMEDTLRDRDWVMVDRTQRRLNRTGIYALRVGDSAWVKRIELDLASKKVKVISDNDRYQVQVLAEEELEVIGRVVWVVGRRV